jgi:hypothetical protein
MSCLLAACDAGEKPAPPVTPGPPARVKVKTDIPDLTYLPRDSDAVIKLDIAAMRNTKLWATHGDRISKLLLPEFADCDRSVMSELSSVMMGLPTASELGVFVFRGIDRDKAAACKRKEPARPLMFVDSKQLVVLTSATAKRETLVELVKQKPNLADDSAFAAAWTTALQRLPPGAVMMVSRPGSKELAEKWSTSGSHLKALSATIRVSDRVDVRVAVAVANETEATQLAALVQSQLKSLKTFLDRADASAQGDTVTMDFGMTETQLGSMLGMLAPMSVPD